MHAAFKGEDISINIDSVQINDIKPLKALFKKVSFENCIIYGNQFFHN